jgi:hypothetical protein
VRVGTNRRGLTFGAWCAAVKSHFRARGLALPSYVGCDDATPRNRHGFSVAGQWWGSGAEPTAWAVQFAEALKHAIPVRVVRRGR